MLLQILPDRQRWRTWALSAFITCLHLWLDFGFNVTPAHGIGLLCPMAVHRIRVTVHRRGLHAAFGVPEQSSHCRPA